MKTKKKNTQRFALALIVLAMTLISGVAKADTITTFDVSGTFTTPSSGTFGGTLVVDVTNGTVSSVDITLAGHPDFNILTMSQPFSPDWLLNVNNSLAETLALQFTTTTPSSLVGFNGGTIDGGAFFLSTGGTGEFLGFSGTIAPAATVPDTGSTLGLLSLSVVALLGATRLRFLQQLAA